MTLDQIKRRDELADMYRHRTNETEITITGTFKAGYDAGFADAKTEIKQCTFDNDLLNDLSDEFGRSQSNELFTIMESARCYRVGFRAAEKRYGNVFKIQDDYQLFLEKHQAEQDDQITELTRKLELAKKALLRLDVRVNEAGSKDDISAAGKIISSALKELE